MFKNSFQSGFLSILYSIGSKPLEIWEKQGEYCARISAPSVSVRHLPPRTQTVGASTSSRHGMCTL